MTGSPRSLADVFDRCQREHRAALIGFLAAGDPDTEATLQYAQAAVRGGVDAIELGIPFSDPLADGPIIQAAYTRALEAGTTVGNVLHLVARLRATSPVPIVLMTAWNPVRAYGVERFAVEAAERGTSGVLVPDLLPEDAVEVRNTLRSAGLDTVFLAAPGTTDARLQQAAAAATGFLYLISRRGVTGPTGGLDEALEVHVERARRAGASAVAVGFGIATADDVARVAACADGVIVGSALVRAAAETYGNATAAGRPRATGVRHAAEAIERLVAALAVGLGRHSDRKVEVAK